MISEIIINNLFPCALCATFCHLAKNLEHWDLGTMQPPTRERIRGNADGRTNKKNAVNNSAPAI